MKVGQVMVASRSHVSWFARAFSCSLIPGRSRFRFDSRDSIMATKRRSSGWDSSQAGSNLVSRRVRRRAWRVAESRSSSSSNGR